MFNLDTDHIGHRRGVHKIGIGRTVPAVIIVLPVFHENTDHLMSLLLE
jgi:hypothetical protein